jgi:hypothetical protein
MEPPHHSFWIEASADMPDILKERCIEAFEKIHSAGILHGDVELRHMLIGGDGKVTIIDFQGSRALDPNDTVMLQKAEPADLLLEMRKVKYKLDHGGARQKEQHKIIRCEELSARNKARRYKHMRRARGERPGYISDYEDDLEEDKTEPPVHKQDWNEHWVIASDATPHRFIMPGQSSDDLDQEVRNFLDIIKRLQITKTSSSVYENVTPSTPPPTPPVTSNVKEESTSLSTGSPLPRYCLRKRNETAVVPTRIPAQRPSIAAMSSASPDASSTFSRSSEAAPAAAAHSDAETVQTFPDNSTFSELLASPERASVPEVTPIQNPSATPIPSSSKPRYPPIKVRDFAYEPYDGPRGFYVPHPPTEARAAKERQWHIARVNAQRCLENNLPHPAVLAHVYDEHQIARIEKGKKPMVQMGSLKRAREDSEHPDAVRVWSAQKKARYELVKKAVNGDISTRKRKREADDVINGYVAEDEFPNVPEGPKILSKAEYINRIASIPSSSSANPRSILRKTRPVRLVSQNREHWIGSHLEKSPKLGPEDLHLRSVGNTVMLGVHYNSYLDSVDENESDPPDSPRKNRNAYRAGDMMALATLGMQYPTPKTRPARSMGRPSYGSITITPDGLARSGTPLAGLPPPRKKVQSSASRGRSSPSSSVRCQTIKLRHPPQPPSRSLSSSSDEERDVEALLQPSDADEVSSPGSWISFFLRFLRS